MDWENFLTMLLSLIGAGAWIPIIITGCTTYFRKIHGTIVDVESLKDFTLSQNDALTHLPKRRKGTLVIIAFNFFIHQKAFLADHYDVLIRLKNGKEFINPVTSENGQSFTQPDGKRYAFQIPFDYNMNIYRMLQPDHDNIRVFAWLLEGDLGLEQPFKLEDVQEIQFTFHQKTRKKTLVFQNCADGKFSIPNFIQQYMVEEKLP